MIFRENDTHKLARNRGTITLTRKLPEDDVFFPGLWEAYEIDANGRRTDVINTEDEIKDMVQA